MKNERQIKILEIIKAEPIETQEQLQQCLSDMGIHCTQATISRDIKQLHLIKEPIGQGKYRYAISIQRKRLNIADKLRTILHESSVSVDYAQNRVVINTMSGLAGAAAKALDSMRINTVLDTVAGDDTVLLVLKDTEQARVLCGEIAEMAK